MRTNRWSKGLAATVAAVAVSALCAGSAFAAPAVFNDAHTPPPPYPNDSDPLVWGIEGTLKLWIADQGGTEARCTSAHLTQPMGSTTTANSGSPLQGSVGGLGVQAFCPMGSGAGYMGVVNFAIPARLAAESNGGVFTLSTSSPAVAYVISNSIFGPQWVSDPSYPIGTYSGVWTNGTSYANPSRLAFTATTVAKRSGSTQQVKVTGTFTARNPQNPNGQLVTLN